MNAAYPERAPRPPGPPRRKTTTGHGPRVRGATTSARTTQVWCVPHGTGGVSAMFAVVCTARGGASRTTRRLRSAECAAPAACSLSRIDRVPGRRSLRSNRCVTEPEVGRWTAIPFRSASVTAQSPPVAHTWISSVAPPVMPADRAASAPRPSAATSGQDSGITERPPESTPACRPGLTAPPWVAVALIRACTERAAETDR